MTLSKNLTRSLLSWGSLLFLSWSFVDTPLLAATLSKSTTLPLSGTQNKTQNQAKNRLTAYQRPVLITGEVQAIDSWPILVPAANVSPVTLRYFVPEGASVKAGEVILRVDSQGDSELERLELEFVQTRERGLKEIAELEVKTVEAERALVTAQSALAKAKIDAALPKAQISALDFDKYQGELGRATSDLQVKLKASDNARDAVKRKLEDSELAVKRLQIQIAYAKVKQAQSEVRAGRDGIVIHGYDIWNGKRLDEGGSAHIGSMAGQIVGAGKLKVVAWVLEADRPFLKEGQTVALRFDAIPGSLSKGRIEHIASATEAKAIWGNGRYFKTDITLADESGLSLQQGMSVSIEVGTESANNLADDAKNQRKSDAPSNLDTASTKGNKLKVSQNTADVGAKDKHEELSIEGEVLSRLSYSIAPPNIQQVWEYTLVMLAPEGSQLKAGEMAAVFEANEVKTRLETNLSSLKEKQRTLEKLVLDHAELAKAADLAVSEAKSNAEKAQRKASLPKELVKRIEYDKLVIERDLFNQLALLSERQRDAQQRARSAEFRGLKTEIAQLQQSINGLQKGQKDLTVLAKKAGTMVHNSGFDGEKFAVGSRVFMGSMVANLADPEKLYVAAKLPEAQVSLVKLGQAVKIVAPGANAHLAAKIIALGPVFHGKSKNQPIIVRDVEIEFDALPKNLKPGTAVQVKLVNPVLAGVRPPSTSVPTSISSTPRSASTAGAYK